MTQTYYPTYGSLIKNNSIKVTPSTPLQKDKYILSPGNSTKKWTVSTPFGKKVSFGAVNYSDFTFHNDESRRKNYEDRHSTREDWTQSGLSTAGFWSKHLLWNKPTLEESIRDIETRFDIKVEFSGDIKGREEYLKSIITH